MPDEPKIPQLSPELLSRAQRGDNEARSAIYRATSQVQGSFSLSSRG